MTQPLFASDLKKVKNRIRHMLIDGVEIELPLGDRFRFKDEGEIIEDGDWVFQCLESGVFKRYETTEDNPKWLLVDNGFRYFEACLDRDIKQINDPMEIEGWFIGIMASQVLTQMNRERSKR